MVFRSRNMASLTKFEKSDHKFSVQLSLEIIRKDDSVGVNNNL